MTPARDRPDGAAAAAGDDARVAEQEAALILRILEGYWTALEQGLRPDRQALLARYPDLSQDLNQRLDALDFVHHVAPQLGAGESQPQPAAAPVDQPTQCLGDFRILREVGRGGMGVVYEAEQISLGRRVALKVLPFAALLDERQLRRFKNEARAAATLEHPHIVSVYAVGSERGVHYYAMRYIEGISLASLITQLRQQEDRFERSAFEAALPGAAKVGNGSEAADRGAEEDWSARSTVALRVDALLQDGKSSAGSMSHQVSGTSIAEFASTASTPHGSGRQQYFRQVAELGIQAAEALEYAHAEGVLHRDVKPGNLLLDGNGDVHLTDFGLARIEGEAGMTVTGDLLGTLRYMSPEQVVGRHAIIDHRADIYSLGVTLYELLTLRPAFAGGDRAELLRRIGLDEPRAPRALNRLIPADLETVVLKAMAKLPAERYGTAGALAADLRRVLAHEPIQARRPTLIQRAAKWCRRHQAGLSTAVLMLITALLLTAAIIAVALQREYMLRVRADEARQEAEASQLRTERLLYAADIRLAHRAWQEGDARQLDELLRRHIPSAGAEDLRGIEWHYLWQLVHSDAIDLAVHTQPWYYVAYSSDGGLLAAAGGASHVRVYETTKPRLRMTLVTRQEDVNGLAFSPDDRLLATAGDDGTVQIWELASGRQLRAWRAHDDEAYNVLFTRDGRLLITCGADTTIRLWDAASGKAAGVLAGHERAVEAIALSPDGRILGSAGSDKTARLWQLETRTLLHRLDDHTDRLSAIAFSPDGRWVATGCLDRSVRCWDAGQGTLVARVEHLDAVQCLAFSADGQRIAAGDRGGTIRLWERVERMPLPTTTRWSLHPADEVQWCALACEGRAILAATRDRLLVRWRATRATREITLANPAILQRVPEPSVHAGGSPLHTMCLAPDSSVLICLNEVHRATSSECTSWELQARLAEDHRWISCVALSPDRRTVLTGLKDGSVVLWDAGTGARRSGWQAHRQDTWVLDAAFAGDGNRLATAGEDGRVVLWDIASQDGQEIWEYREPCWCLAFTPDSKRLAAGSFRELRLWEVASGRQCGRFHGHQGALQSLAISGDGSRIASAATDGTVHVWDVRTERLLHRVAVKASCVSFAPDGRTLLTGGGDNTIRIWQQGTRQAVALQPSQRLQRHQGRVYSVAFSADGGQLASAGQDGQVLLSRAPSGAGRDRLTPPGWAYDAAFTNDGIVVADTDGVHLLDAGDGERLHSFATTEREWLAVAVSPHGRLLAALSRAGTVSVWSLGSRRSIGSWQSNTPVERAGRLAFLPDETGLAVAHSDHGGTVSLIDLATMEVSRQFPAPSCTDVAFAPDGARLAVATLDDVAIWDPTRARKLARLQAHSNTVEAVVFSPDGRLLATAGGDRKLVVRDAVGGQQLFSVTSHRSRIQALAFSPDSRTLLSADLGGTVKVWQVATGTELLELDAEPTAVQRLAFSPDGTQLLYVRQDGTLRLLRIAAAE